MAYNTDKHGLADYKSWMQLPNGTSITEGTDAVPLSAQQFAALTYQVNPTSVALSGVTIGASVGIDGTGAVHVTSNQLLVKDTAAEAALNELVVSNTYSVITVSNETYTYSMFAPPGTASGSAAWRVSRTDASKSRMWADGNANFDNVASNYTALTYTF